MAGFMDFGIGCLISVILANVLHYPISWWVPIVAGAIFNVLPDYDIVPFILRRGITGVPFNFDHHQTWLHWPVVVLPVVTAFMWLIFGAYWGLLALSCVLAHYIHDAVFMKNGLVWLLRLRRTYPVGTYDRHMSPPDDWIATNWLQPSRLSIYEMLIGIASLSIATFLATNSPFIAALVGNVAWISTTLFWWSYAYKTGGSLFKTQTKKIPRH
jgi:hypothetical protein